MLIAAAALWLPRILFNGSDRSPLPTAQPAPQIGASPLLPAISAPTSAANPPSWTGAGTALLWTSVGLLLALGLAFIFVHRYRRVE